MTPPRPICKNGHRRTPENVSKNGSCIPCRREQTSAAYRLRQDAAGKPPQVYDPERFPCGHDRTTENARPGRTDCGHCHREAQMRRYHADPGTHRRKSSQWQKLNRSAANARHTAWRWANIEHQRAYSRRARKLRRLSRRDADTAAYIDILSGDPCSYCGGLSAHVDHIEPLSTGGPNHWTNYTAACAQCNYTKHTRSLLRFLLECPLTNHQDGFGAGLAHEHVEVPA